MYTVFNPNYTLLYALGFFDKNDLILDEILL